MLRRSVLTLLMALLPGLATAARAQVFHDPRVEIEQIVSGLDTPTSMAFIAPDDILVLEKAGPVRRILHGALSPTPVATLSVDPYDERGALGIAVDTASPPHVFLFFTEAATPGGTAIANRVYRYDWNPESATLTDPTLVLDLPVGPSTNHNSGVIVLGPPGEAPGVGDGSLLYVVIGEMGRFGQLQNVVPGAPPDDSGVILRVRQDGTPAPGNPFTPYCSTTTATTCSADVDCPGGETCTTQVARYYAYGIRNSFGLALDPVTGSLWDTENGFTRYDEVNRIAPGLNSGWFWLQGPDARSEYGIDNLFHMPGAGVTYADPAFSWYFTVAPTGIVVPYHSSLGAAFDHVVLVGDYNFGRIHALPLNESRTALDVSSTPGLEDLVADTDAEVDAHVVGEEFGQITDLEIGPDGALYVVTIGGNVFRVRKAPLVPALPFWGAGAIALLLLAGAATAFARSRYSGSNA
jgi:glucose/arabinose dehydrogenase